jgi:hypothetical protein
VSRPQDVHLDLVAGILVLLDDVLEPRVALLQYGKWRFFPGMMPAGTSNLNFLLPSSSPSRGQPASYRPLSVSHLVAGAASVHSRVSEPFLVGTLDDTAVGETDVLAHMRRCVTR